MLEVKPLPWDSEHFGIKVGRVDLLSPELDNLVEVLNRARRSNYRLVYVFTPGGFAVDPFVLNQNVGALVDRRVDFSTNLLNTVTEFPSPAIAKDFQTRIVRRDYGPADSQLVELGFLAGHCSRFMQDTNIDKQKARRLFEIWIEKSALNINGEQVLLAMGNDGQVAGMATVSSNIQEGRVGLISVLAKYQGLGIGKQLLAGVFDYGKKQQAKRMKVTTQEANHSAMRLYLNSGFTIESVSNTYHFWL